MDYVTKIIDIYNEFFPQSTCEVRIIYDSSNYRYKATVGMINSDIFCEFKSAWHNSSEGALRSLYEPLLKTCQDFVEKEVKEVIEA